MNRAQNQWEWIDSVPNFTRLVQPQIRVRFLTQDEFARLLNELPAHLNVMVVFSLATGLRESNVTRLEWSQVDMVRQFLSVHADDAKGKKLFPFLLILIQKILLRIDEFLNTTSRLEKFSFYKN